MLANCSNGGSARFGKPGNFLTKTHSNGEKPDITGPVKVFN